MMKNKILNLYFPRERIELSRNRKKSKMPMNGEHLCKPMGIQISEKNRKSLPSSNCGKPAFLLSFTCVG